MRKSILSYGTFLLYLACFPCKADSFLLEDIAIRSQGEVNPNKLKSVLKNYIGKSIDAHLLQQVINEVSTYYQDSGYPGALAVIPEQNLTSGILNIEVLTPKLNLVFIKNNPDYLNDSAEKRLFAPLYSGQDKALNLDTINSALLKLSDLNQFNLEASFNTNPINYLDDLNINVKPHKRFEFLAFSDNHGTDASGKYRFGTMVKVNSVTTNADNLSLFYARSSQKQNNYSITYEIPLNSHPSVLGLNVCLSDYELGKDYAQLGARGKAQTYELYLKEPLYRTDNLKFEWLNGLYYRDLQDEFKNFNLKFKKHAVAGYSSLNLQTNYANFFTSSFLKGIWGHLYIDDKYGFNDENSYVIGNVGVNLGYRFNDFSSIGLQSKFQVASASLEGSEQFSITGPDGVDAYEPSLVLGDGGALASLFLDFTPFKNIDFSLSPHLDAATAKYRGFEYQNAYGAGIVADIKFHGLFAKAQFSKTLGKKPFPECDDSQFFFNVGFNFF